MLLIIKILAPDFRLAEDIVDLLVFSLYFSKIAKVQFSVVKHRCRQWRSPPPVNVSRL